MNSRQPLCLALPRPPEAVGGDGGGGGDSHWRRPRLGLLLPSSRPLVPLCPPQLPVDVPLLPQPTAQHAIVDGDAGAVWRGHPAMILSGAGDRQARYPLQMAGVGNGS